MKLISDYFNLDSREMEQIDAWKKHPYANNLRKYLFKNCDEYGMRDLVEDHLHHCLHENTKRLAVCYKNPEYKLANGEEEIAGFALIEIYKDKRSKERICYIDYICTNPEYLLANIPGVGRYMINDIVNNNDNVLDLRKNQQIDLFMAQIVKDNVASKKIFKSAGFEIEETPSNFVAIKRQPSETDENERI